MLKTLHLKYTSKSLNIIFGFLLIISFNNVSSQVDDTSNDTVKGFNKGKITISNPKSIVDAYTFDPISNKYILNRKI